MVRKPKYVFISFHTSAFRCIGPSATGSALCSFITNKHVWRQALESPSDTIISGVRFDLLVKNYHPKLWDWSETTGNGYKRRER